jgi:hypothetical protein
LCMASHGAHALPINPTPSWPAPTSLGLLWTLPLFQLSPRTSSPPDPPKPQPLETCTRQGNLPAHDEVSRSILSLLPRLTLPLLTSALTSRSSTAPTSPQAPPLATATAHLANHGATPPPAPPPVAFPAYKKSSPATPSAHTSLLSSPGHLPEGAEVLFVRSSPERGTPAWSPRGGGARPLLFPSALFFSPSFSCPNASIPAAQVHRREPPLLLGRSCCEEPATGRSCCEEKRTPPSGPCTASTHRRPPELRRRQLRPAGEPSPPLFLPCCLRPPPASLDGNARTTACVDRSRSWGCMGHAATSAHAHEPSRRPPPSFPFFSLPPPGLLY